MIKLATQPVIKEGAFIMSKNFSRRTFLKLASSALLLAGAGGAWYEQRAISRLANRMAGEVSGAIDASFLRQIVAADNKATRTIMWQAAAVQKDAAVELRAVGAETVKTFLAMSEPYSDDGVSSFLQTARLDGLTAGQSYEYRLRDGKRAGAWQKLRADDGKSFSALLFPDSQSNDYSGWQELARNAYECNSDADFFINMGDLVDNGEDHRQWEAWFDAVAPLTQSIPVAPIMGNHETYDQNWKVRLPKAYLALFAVPEVGSEPFHRYYYSFDYGPAHFIVLNTQQDETDSFHPGLLDEQQAWFAEDVKKSNAVWNIVLMHKDPLQYSFQSRPGRAEGFSDDGRAWMPLFDAQGIDVVLSAHLHTYRDRGHIKNFQRDASGPLYILTGVAGNVRYPNLWKDHSLDVTVAPQPEVDNYMTLRGDAHALEIASYQPDGSTIEVVRLKK